MPHRVIFCLLFCIPLTQVSFSQSAGPAGSVEQNSDMSRMTPKQKAAVNAIAKNHRHGAVSVDAIKKEVRQRTDLASMSVESAVKSIMMQMQQDAEKDLKSANAEVKAANEKKDSLRKKVAVNKDRDELQHKLKNEYDSLKLASTSSNQKNQKYTLYLKEEKNSEAEAAEASKRKKAAEAHLTAIKEALSKNQQ